MTDENIWRHTKSGKLYRLVSHALNVVTDQVDVIYEPLYESIVPRFSRQLVGHEKAWMSKNEDGSNRFERVPASSLVALEEKP